MSRTRVYVACSLDGFIAGPDGDLSWLPEGDPSAVPGSGGVGFHAFIADVGALLMGRNTYDFLAGYGGPWHYGERPVLVATHRDCRRIHELVRPVQGDIASLVAQGKAAAGGKDLYIDGGILIRQALDAGLVDECIVTLIPTVLGDGVPLFAGTTRRHAFLCASHETHGDGLVQLHLRPR
ncbi:MAG: dihydrofolate reductase [Planctomycetes bacterium]|nr:dihydrofolate reductase [Planctomycetota bacterium]